MGTIDIGFFDIDIVSVISDINVKKLPQKFNIIVRVEMAHLKRQKITLLRQKYHKHDLTVCSA